MSNPGSDRVLALIEAKIGIYERQLLEGAIGGETAEQRASNYSALVKIRRDLFSIKAEIERLNQTEDQVDENLQPMEGI